MKSGSFKGSPQKKVIDSANILILILLEKLIHLENDACSALSSVFRILLNEHAPLKSKRLRYNNKTFITKELRKEIMKRSKPKNLFNTNKNQEN